MIVTYAQWLLRLRWVVIIGTFGAVFFLGSGGKFLEFTNDYRVFFGEGNPQLAAFENLQDTYAKNDNVLIMFKPKSGNTFDREILQAITEMTEDAWQTPFSTRVDSLSNFQNTYADEDDLVVADLIENPAQMQEMEIEKASATALNEPLLINRTVSPEKNASGINITIELPGINQTTEAPEVATAVRAMVDKYREKYPNIEFFITGVIMMNNAFPEATKNDMTTLIPMAFLAIIAGLFIFLRSITGTISSVILIIFSIMMAMGSTGWLGIKLTPPSASAPTMILTLAVADSVHFLSSMLFQMRKGLSKYESIIESLRINLSPIFLTSLTTAIGFLSMNFSDAPPFRDLGNITAMGVIFAFILSVTFLPAMMAVLPVKTAKVDSAQSSFMDSIAGFVIKRQSILLWSIGLLIVTLVILIPRNQLNDVFVEYFDESIEFRRDTDMVADTLTGMYFIDYSLDSKKSGGISEPEFQRKIESFANWYRKQPEVKHVNVITDTFRRLNKNMHGDDKVYYELPKTRELSAQYLLLYEMSLPYGLDLNNQINIDKSATRITVTLETLSTVDTLKLEERAQQWFADNEPELSVNGASPTIMFSHIGMRNIKSMLYGTSIALLLISVILIFALGSLKIGLLSLIPNLAPAGMAFGIWALLVGQVGLALSVVVAMTLGIVVDDTVHFLSKYLRARREQNLNSEDAIRYAFSSVGVALWVTTIVLVVGFLILSQSSFSLNSEMGLLTALTISIALFVDFLLLPPILMRLDRNKSV